MTIPAAISDLIARGALFVVNHSGGKDSQAMYHTVRRFVPVEQIAIVYAELPGVTWQGTLDHIRATTHGLPAHTCQAVDKAGNPKSFFDMVEARGFFPSPKQRQCTSDLKRTPIEKVVRRLSRETGRKLIVNCMGLRAEESSQRAKQQVFKATKRNSKAGRQCYEWLPIHDWTIDQVFAAIAAAGQKPHWAYAAGMTRLSCCFCIMSSQADMATAARLRPDLLRAYAELERRVDHTMTMPGKDGRRFLDERFVVADPAADFMARIEAEAEAIDATAEAIDIVALAAEDPETDPDPAPIARPLVKLPIHGGPVTPIALLDQLVGQSFCVSYMRPEQAGRMAEICRVEAETGRRPWVHMMRGLGLLHEWPWNSADSSNIARNHNRTKHRPRHVETMADRIGRKISASNQQLEESVHHDGHSLPASTDRQDRRDRRAEGGKGSPESGARRACTARKGLRLRAPPNPGLQCPAPLLHPAQPLDFGLYRRLRSPLDRDRARDRGVAHNLVDARRPYRSAALAAGPGGAARGRAPGQPGAPGKAPETRPNHQDGRRELPGPRREAPPDSPGMRRQATRIVPRGRLAVLIIAVALLAGCTAAGPGNVHPMQGWEAARLAAVSQAGAAAIPAAVDPAAAARRVASTVRYRREPPGAWEWRTPQHTLRRGGDCEDLALLAAAMLVAGGADPGSLAIAVVDHPRGPHAVLIAAAADGALSWHDATTGQSGVGIPPGLLYSLAIAG